MTRVKTPEQAARWRANADAKAAAKHAAFLAEQRDRMANYTPPNVRTYGTSPNGIDYDAIIAAAVDALSLPGAPNKGVRR